MIDIYQKAFVLFLKRLEQKTTWGKQEVKNLLLECLVEVGQSA